MGVGTLIIQARTAGGALPATGAEVVIQSVDGQTLYRLTTDGNGNTEQVSLYSPDRANTLDPNNPGPYFGSYDVTISHPRYMTNIYRDVQVYDKVESVLEAAMLPLASGASRSAGINEYDTPPPAVAYESARDPEAPLIMPVVLQDVVIPEYITVHLGAPSSSAKNIRVSFTDYIKNVASSEIFPTWPQASLEANIYAQITFALNRIYTEWYRSRGYVFDITSSTAYDQSFVENRNIFENISLIVDNIFNRYARLKGEKNPYFTQYCNGTTVTCPGLSQWGTVTLANQGLDPLQILRAYYPSDIEITETNNIASITESYPGSPLRVGSSGSAVRMMQDYLNRIRADYPLIPRIANPNGVFGQDTAQAVRTFQSIFGLTQDGVIGKDTWYKISYLYVAVKRLSELESEGERIGIGSAPPTSVLSSGSRGRDVVELQYLLNFIAEFYPSVPTVIQDGRFDALTQTSVRAFQSMAGLTADGIVGPATWQALYNVYKGIENNVEIPPETGGGSGTAPSYPGTLLRYGSSGESVRLMQQYLYALSGYYPSIPSIPADGIFGPTTQNAVLIFQRLFGLSQDGIIGPQTWDRIVSEYNSLSSGGNGGGSGSLPEYPGYLIGLGSRGSYVQTIQQYLNSLSSRYPSIPSISGDGIFGPATQGAVMAFQRAAGLTADGIVGRDTWNRLGMEYGTL